MEMTATLTLPARGSGAPLDQMALAQLAEAGRCEAGSLTGTWWPRGAPGEGGAFPAMAAGVRTRDADALADSIEAGGLEVVAVDVRGCALARACGPALDGGAAVTAIVSIGHSAAMVVAVLGGVPVYERVLPESGLKELHDRLSKNLGMEAESIGYALARVAGLGEQSEADVPEGETLDEVRGMVEAHAQTLAREVQVSLSYAASTAPGATPGSAIVVGDGAEIPGLCAMFGAALGQPARVVRPVEIAQCPAVLHGVAGHASLVLACGLAMNDPRAVAGEARP
jgi:Tfp pilus assembly PilM family ATPase